MPSENQIHVSLVSESDHPDAVETFELLKAKGGVSNIHRTLANSPTVFKNFIGMAHALRFATEIDPLDRELAICCVLERHNGEYELAPHRRLASVYGASPEQVKNVRNRNVQGVYSDRQRAILHFAEHVAADPAERDTLSPHDIEAFLDNRQRIELGMTLAFYMALSHFTAVFHVPAEDFDAPGAPSIEQAARA